MKPTTPLELNWRPDKNSAVPVYRQITQFICQKISSGEWAIGMYLPTQRALAAAFKVNRSTVATAFDELTSYGVIQGASGAGTQIVSNTWSLFLSDAPNWDKHIATGFFQANNAAVQAINRLEPNCHIIRLGTGELDPDLFPRQIWQKILQKLSGEITQLGYLPPTGLPKLRRAVSVYLQTLGIDAPINCILITSGALQALQLISVSLLKGNSLIFTEAPTYLKSLQIFQSAGMKLHGIAMDKNGIKCRQMNTVLNHSKPPAAILYTIPTNHNPTGITMSLERRRELMDFCIAKQIPIIEDGAYNELYYSGRPPLTLKSMDKSGMVIYLGSASKFLASGLRVGWVVASEPIIQRLSDVKMQFDYGASSISQHILTEFLTGGDHVDYLASVRRQLQCRCNNALAVLEKYFSDIAVWNRPKGGFYIWLTLKKVVSMEKLFNAALRENILLNIGDIYDFKKNNSLRLSFAYLSPNEFTIAAKKLAEIIHEINLRS